MLPSSAKIPRNQNREPTKSCYSLKIEPSSFSNLILCCEPFYQGFVYFILIFYYRLVKRPTRVAIIARKATIPAQAPTPLQPGPWGKDHRSFRPSLFFCLRSDSTSWPFPTPISSNVGPRWGFGRCDCGRGHDGTSIPGAAGILTIGPPMGWTHMPRSASSIPRSYSETRRMLWIPTAWGLWRSWR